MNKNFDDTIRLPTIITDLEALKMTTKAEKKHIDKVAGMVALSRIEVYTCGTNSNIRGFYEKV